MFEVGQQVQYRNTRSTRTAKVVRVLDDGFFGEDTQTLTRVWVSLADLPQPETRCKFCHKPAEDGKRLCKACEAEAQVTLVRWAIRDTIWRKKLDLPYHVSTDLRLTNWTHAAERSMEDDRQAIRKQFAHEREQRQALNEELVCWWRRQSVPLADVGTASVMQDAFVGWLKRIKKALPLKKQLNDVATWYEIKDHPLFGLLRLDVCGGFLTAYYWTISSDGQASWCAFAERLPAPNTGDFTAQVDFETLYDLVKLLSADRLDLKKCPHDAALHVYDHNNHSRFTHHIVQPQVAHWLKGELS